MNEDRAKDYDSSDEDLRILMRIIASTMNKKDAQIGYMEGGVEKRMLTWLLGIVASLLIVAVVSGVTMYGKLSAVEANQANQQRQLDQLASTVASIRSAQ
jgi:cell division protein FtsB